MRYRHIAMIILFSVTLWGCGYMVLEDPKINGVSFVASPNKLQQEHIEPLLDVQANYVSVMPFGFIRSLDHPEIIFNTDRQWYGETTEGARQYIHLLHENTIRVMLKPQIWIWNGEYTGDLTMTTEEDWVALEKAYRSFILEYAQLAEDTKVTMFCIGTELEQFIVHRPDYWNELIEEIRTVYHGKLTYAANWDEYKRVPFWKALDYIGVDAYFPLSELKTPTIEEARSGWIPWKNELQQVAMAHNKKVVFAEFGYRSVDYAGKEPWKSDISMDQVNLEAQKNLTQVVFEEVWEEKWFAGGFIWKWFIQHDRSGGVADSQFTPQNKPAERVVKNAFGSAK